MALSKKYKADITACEKLVSAFVKKHGHIFGFDEKQMLQSVKAQEFLGRGAVAYTATKIKSNISDKLKVGETKPFSCYLWLSSDINPNGVSSIKEIARTYVIHLEIKGKKRVTQRVYNDSGIYFKIYDYGTSVEQVLEKIQSKIYSIEKLIKEDGLAFEDIAYIHKYDNGGGVGTSSDDLSDNEIGTGADMNLDQYGKGSTVKGGYSDKFKEVVNIGSQSIYVRSWGHVETDKFPKIELVSVATITDLEDYMAEDELPEEGHFGLNITLCPIEKFISKKHKESANDDSNSLSDNTIVNIVNYMGGLNYKPEEKVAFKTFEEAEKYLFSKELNDKISAQGMMSGFVLDNRYNRAGQSNRDYLAYMTGERERFDNGGGVGISSDDLSDDEIGTGADMNIDQYSKGSAIESGKRFKFSIEYKEKPTSKVFKKSSLTMVGLDSKMMNWSINKNAELLKEQEGWYEVKVIKTLIMEHGGSTHTDWCYEIGGL